MTTILVVDDVAAMADQYAYDLRRLGGYDSLVAPGGAEALEVLAREAVDAVLLDLEMPGTDGFAVLRALRERGLDVPVIVYTGTGSYDRCIQAIRLGADGFIDKGEPMPRVVREIEAALERRRLMGEVASLKARLGVDTSLAGSSAPMRGLREAIARLAPLPSPVLVEGESGTGKELVARDLHRLSGREKEPFIALNCAALPESLIESELFGHERGAFTDAKTAKPGLFEVAQGGTLFLDEIDHLAPELQGKLLRALEQKSVRRLGATASRTVNVRIVAATNTDLAAAVQAGGFREDLYYRLNVVTLELPPLRERGEDVMLLAEFFLTKFSAQYGLPQPAVTAEVRRALLAHAWPGNIRELRNTVERAVLLSPSGTFALGELEYRPLRPTATSGGMLPFPAPLAEIQRAAARAMLEATGGNRSAAARRLGISRSRLQRLLEEGGASEVSGDDTDADTN